ncbi:hypothetical protein [Polaribacter sp.]|uniref:hypothetical protein n=1 Tax=Polaribacter sp. TaxID=1920175 RepID=UPI003F6C916C
MKNLKKYYLTTLVMFTISLTAQVQRQNGLSITIKGPNTEIEGVVPENAAAKTQQLRFYTEEYQKAIVDDLKNEFYFRYNIFADEMEFIKNGTIYFLSKTENQIINFVVIDKKFTVLKLDGKLQYFELNVQGNASLYTKQNVEFKKGKVAVTQFETTKKSKFVRNRDSYYVSINNGELTKLPRRKKDFYKLFNEQSNMIKKYMKKEKLNRKKIEDLVTIFNYYNSQI